MQPRWGKIGKQRIEDEGPLPPHPMPGIKYNMETVDEDILDYSVKFIDKAKTGRQAVLRVDESDPRARHLASVAEIPGEADPREPVVSGRRRDVAARRRRRRPDGTS